MFSVYWYMVLLIAFFSAHYQKAFQMLVSAVFLFAFKLSFAFSMYVRMYEYDSRVRVSNVYFYHYKLYMPVPW